MRLLDATLIAIGVLVVPSVLVCGLLWLLDRVRNVVARVVVGCAVLLVFAGLYALPAGLLSLPS